MQMSRPPWADPRGWVWTSRGIITSRVIFFSSQLPEHHQSSVRKSLHKAPKPGGSFERPSVREPPNQCLATRHSLALLHHSLLLLFLRPHGLKIAFWRRGDHQRRHNPQKFHGMASTAPYHEWIKSLINAGYANLKFVDERVMQMPGHTDATCTVHSLGPLRISSPSSLRLTSAP
jgi:hypothetical protein